MGEVKIVDQLLDGAALFLEFHLSRLKSRNLQNIIDEHQQQNAALIDRLGKQLLVGLVKVLLQGPQVREAYDRVQRRTYLMAHVRQEHLYGKPGHEGADS